MYQKESEWNVLYALEDNGFFEHIEKLKEISDGERKKEEWNDVLNDALKVIEKVFSNREKEIAEEVKRILPNRPIDFRTGDTVSDRWEGMEQAIEDVLQIMKH